MVNSSSIRFIIMVLLGLFPIFDLFEVIFVILPVLRLKFLLRLACFTENGTMPQSVSEAENRKEAYVSLEENI